jgi:acyl-CoA thioesterase-1
MSRLMGLLLAGLLALPAARGGTVVAAGPATGSAAAPVVLVFGDSLSAGLGLRAEQGWVSLLAQRIERAGYGFHVVNASVSGETTAGGLERLPRALALHRPRIVLLELGANDGLRGLPLDQARGNLTRMLGLLQRQRIGVLLLGVRLPPNYGERYTDGFQAMYRDLAERFHVALLPFLLEHVALHPELIQADGLHPNARAQPLLLDNVWPQLMPLLSAAAAPRHNG